MTKVRFDYSEKKALQLPDMEVECVPAKGDVVHVAGARHLVVEREFWVDHDKIEHVTLHLGEMKS